MKKLLFAICTLILTACTNKIEKTEMTDHVQAFYINKNIFLIGEKYDYEFYSGDIKLIEQFLTSPLWKKAIAADIQIEARNGGKMVPTADQDGLRQVVGRYFVYLDPKKLTKAELEQAKSTFHFEEREDLKSRFKEKTVLSKKFYADGMLMHWSHHNEVLAKFPVRQTLPIQLTIYDGKLEASGEAAKSAAIAVVAAPLAVPFVALGTVILIPYFAYGAMTGGVN